MPVISGFLLGFLGSLHCVGMCGPIVMALPADQSRRWFFFLSRAVYHLGRITTYAVLGVIFGIIGDKIRMFSFQQHISVGLGVVILAVAVMSLTGSSFISKIKIADRLYGRLKQKLSVYIQKKSMSSQYILGILNGLLPCGFVYVAITGAVAMGGILSGTLFMISFGLGTAPALILLAWLPGVLKFRKYFSTRRLIPLISIIFACLIILRGLNLGIPFLSPKMSKPAISPAATDTLKVNQQIKTGEEGSCCEQ